MDFLERLLRPLRTGVVTSRYPDEPPLLAPAIRGLPQVDPARCELDRACVTSCPTRAIQVTEAAAGDGEAAPASWSIDAGACIFCGECARVCPPGAIWLGPIVELAARSRSDLVSVMSIPRRKGGPG